MNVRSDSILASLTQSQLADLYDWILASDGYAAVQTRAAKPVADGGLGLNIHITTLTRFYASYTNWLRAKEIADGERDPDSSPDHLHTSAAAELAHAVHDLARGPLKPTDLKLMAKYLQQQRDHALKTEYLKIAQHHAALATQKQKLAENRLAEQVRQWEFCGAREVMKAYVAYAEIDKRTDIDEIDKIWEARKVAYGPRADETPKPKRSTQIHAVPESPQLRTQNSGLKTAAQAESPLSPPCPPKLHAKEEDLSPQPGPLASSPVPAPQRNPDTIVNTSSHYAASDTPLGPPGSRPAPAAQRSQDTIVNTGLHNPANEVPDLTPQSPPPPPLTPLSPVENSDPQLNPACPPKLYAQERELGPEKASSPARSLTPKSPSEWLATARNPTRFRNYMRARYCDNSPSFFATFLAAPDPLSIPKELLEMLNELP